MSICVYVYVYVCKCICICIYVYMYICICIYVRVRVWFGDFLTSPALRFLTVSLFLAPARPSISATLSWREPKKGFPFLEASLLQTFSNPQATHCFSALNYSLWLHLIIQTVYSCFIEIQWNRDVWHGCPADPLFSRARINDCQWNKEYVTYCCAGNQSAPNRVPFRWSNSETKKIFQRNEWTPKK